MRKSGRHYDETANLESPLSSDSDSTPEPVKKSRTEPSPQLPPASTNPLTMSVTQVPIAPDGALHWQSSSPFMLPTPQPTSSFNFVVSKLPIRMVIGYAPPQGYYAAPSETSYPMLDLPPGYYYALPLPQRVGDMLALPPPGDYHSTPYPIELPLGCLPPLGYQFAPLPPLSPYPQSFPSYSIIHSPTYVQNYYAPHGMFASHTAAPPKVYQLHNTGPKFP